MLLSTPNPLQKANNAHDRSPFVQTKTSIGMLLNSRLYLHFMNFSTEVLFLFQDSTENTTMLLAIVFFVKVFLLKTELLNVIWLPIW